MAATGAQVIDMLRAAGEPTRLRVLALLAREELAVLELGRVLGQSQPRVSRHLKLLTEAGLVERFADGAWAFFRLASGGPAHGFVAGLLALAEADDPLFAADREALAAVRAERRTQAADYFAANAGRWGGLRSLHTDEAEVEAAVLRAAGPGPFRRLVDLGTGTGCILIALLSELRAAWGLGTDRSDEALGTAWGNALRNGVANRTLFAASDWGAAIAGRFDLLVANPPYIPSRSIRHLAPEVATHDPAAALDGGGDGLDAYRRLFADVPRLLRPGGRAFVEIGFDQADDTADLARQAGLAVDRVVADLAGHRRVLVLKER